MTGPWRILLHRCITLCFCLVALGLQAPFAQGQSYDPVVVPWTLVPPVSFADENGNASGFGNEIARLIAKEVGFDIEFQFFETIPEVAGAQARGDTDMLPAVGYGPAFRDTNFASDTISEVQVRLMIRIEDLDSFDPSDLTDRRIAVVPPTIASDPTLYPGAKLIEKKGPEAALVALLSGEVDAVAYPGNVMFAMTRETRLDGRITFVGPSLKTIQRVVLMHETRPELVEPVNAVLRRLEASGALDELRAKYLIFNPIEVPDVLQVGIHRVPPFVDLTEEGEPTGFGVEVLEDLARLAGLQLEYVPITDADFGIGPRDGIADLVPMMAWNEDRAHRMDFTFPTHRVPFSIFTLKDSDARPETLADLRGLRVAVEKGKNTAQLAESFGGLDLVYVDGKDGTMNALLNRDADALLSPTNAFWTHVEQRGQREAFRSSDRPFYVSESGPALRLGLGQVRERLNAVIPGYLISDDYAARQKKWFGHPVFWTEMRIKIAVAFLSLATFVVLSFAIWQKLQRSRDRERQARLLQHSRQLEVLVDELERSNRELDSFADIASHDLKEPLRAINWQVKALKEASDGQEADLPAEVVRIAELCGQMETTISTLLSSSQHRGKGLGRANIDMETLIEEIRGDLAELKMATGGRLLVETPLPKVHASRAKMKVVFQNLIANGFIHNTSPTPVVRVGYLTAESTDPSGLIHVFYVRDNGIGIAPEDQLRMFKPGERGANAGGKDLPGATGSGLGLSFAKEIIESYGQLITLDSSVGKGTTFYFSLPNPMSQEDAPGDEPVSMDAST